MESSASTQANSHGDSKVSVEVRTLKREIIMLSANSLATISSLKQQLADLRHADGWQVDTMNLILQGRFLSDDVSASDLTPVAHHTHLADASTPRPHNLTT